MDGPPAPGGAVIAQSQSRPESPASAAAAADATTPPDPIEALLGRGYRYALALTHDEAQAEDILQDAVYAILRRDAPRSVGYLLAAIRNRFIDTLRRKQRIDFRPLAADETPPPLTFLGEPDERVDPERMNEALAQLKPYEREVLFLAYVVEYTAQEIADLMVCPRGTVLSLMHRTRKKMHALLAGSAEVAE